MKALVGASLVIIWLIGCAAPARLSMSSGTSEGFITGEPEKRRFVTAGVIDAKGTARAARPGGAEHVAASEERIETLSQNWRAESGEETAEYDPWEPFNEKMFSFNYRLDRYFLKPLARVWNKILPDPVQESLSNAFENLGMPRRLVNNLFQLKGKGAGRELARFFLNTTMGIVGFFDVATELGIDKSDEDTGQTLGVYGVGPGPYLILPFLPPLTIRDGIGFAIDGALDPLNYFIPFAANTGRTGAKVINERSVNLELFEGVEATVLDLYTAVRNAYLQRRQRSIAE